MTESPSLEPTVGFHALSDPLRWQILTELLSQECCVCDLCDRLQVQQSRLSFHLKVLRQAGLLQVRQDHRWSYYRLVPEAFAKLQRQLQPFVEMESLLANACP